jgi:hypothetical protein
LHLFAQTYLHQANILLPESGERSKPETKLHTPPSNNPVNWLEDIFGNVVTADLEQLELEAIAIWEYLTNAPSYPAQLERLYLKVLAYLAGYTLTQSQVAAATATPGIIGGSAEAYRQRILAISSEIADAGITSPSPNNLTIHLLAKTGTPSTALINQVQVAMSNDQNRMICDVVTTQAATRIDYTINAGLTISLIADEAIIIGLGTAALTVLNDYTVEERKLGKDVLRSDIIKILRGFPEIINVNLISPPTDLTIPPQSFGNAATITLTVTGRG